MVSKPNFTALHCFRLCRTIAIARSQQQVPRQKDQTHINLHKLKTGPYIIWATTNKFIILIIFSVVLINSFSFKCRSFKVSSLVST